jgi:hypothetical protein
MALPVTITGVAVTCGTGAGPYKSSAGDYYQIFKDSTTANKIRAFKSSGASDSAWSNVGTDVTVTGVTTAPGIAQVDAWQDGDTLHVAVACVGSPTTATTYTYHTFDMSSDSWTLSNEAIASNVETLSDQSGTGNPRGISICKRTSSGEIFVALQTTVGIVSMAEYSRIGAYRRTGVGAWSAIASAVDGSGTTTTASYVGPVCQPDPNSDAVYIGCMARTTNVVWLCTVTAANTVFRTSVSTWAGLIAGQAGNLQLACYDASGTTKLAMWANAAAVAWDVRYAYGDGNATGAVTLSNANFGTTEGGNPFRFYSDDNSGTDTLYIVGTEWSGHATNIQDLYVRASTNHGQTWGSKTYIFTPATVVYDTLLTNSHGSIYTRGGNYVIPYTVNDNGTVKYNEHILRAAGTSYSVTGGITAGSIPIVGATVATKAVRSITVTAGALPITGATVTPRYGRTVSITPASIPIAGATVTPVFAKTLAVTAGAIPITGATVTPVHETGGTDYSITVTAGAIPITGVAVTPVFAKTIAITAGALPITGATVSPVFARRIAVTAGSLPITGATVTPVKARSIAVTAGAIPITGASVAPVFAKTIAVTPASLPITGASVDTVYSGGTDYTITVTAGSLPITGALVAPVFAKAIAVTPASLPIAGATVAPVHARSITVTPASIPIAGANVVPFKTGGSTDYTLTIEPGALPIEGAAVVPVHSAASEQISHVVGVQVPGGPTPRKALREAAERLRKRREEATTQTAIKATDKALAAVAKAETLVSATATADDPSKPVTDALSGLERVLMTFREQSTARALREWTARVEAQAAALQREIDDEEEVLMLLLAA